MHPDLDNKSIEVFGNIKHYEYLHVFDFEKWTFNHEVALAKWLQVNWTISFYISAVYAAFVILGQMYMKKRAAFDLRTPLAIWSTVLALFSIFAAVRVYPEFLYGLTTQGLYYTVCSPNYFYKVSGFWSFLFVLSKPYELGDTVFIVFRKQKLIFLHWYHHITVMLYVWQSYSEHNAAGRWFYVLNYTVHAFMYSYYAARAWRFRTPRWVNIFITALQIIQMVFGTSFYLYVWNLRSNGFYCQISHINSVYGFLMYLSYLMLFSHFFYNTYLRGPARAAHKQTQEDSSSVSGSKSSNSLFHKDVTGVLKSVAEIERSGYVKKVK